MNDVPLIQNADVNSINTSIIAIKKQLNQISELLGLIDIPDAPDLSPFVRKDEVADVIEADNMNPVTSNAVATSTAMPVDEVTANNMYSVTSGAVYARLVSGTSWTSVLPALGNEFIYKIVGKTVYLHLYSTLLKFSNNGYLQYNGNNLYLPSEIRPSRIIDFPIIDNSTDMIVHARFLTDGRIQSWSTSLVNIVNVISWMAELTYRID